MKLTTEQIAEIDETLVLNGLIYDDIKLEVTDHIASEIEAKMDESSISFDDALFQVLLNWKEQMKPSSSFLIGRKNAQPKIVIDKWVSIHKQQSLNILKSLFIISLILILFTRIVTVEKFSKEITIVIRSFYLIFWISIVICRMIIYKSKKMTITGLIFKNNSLIYIVALFTLGVGISPIHLFNSNSSFNLWTDLSTILFFIASFSLLQLAYKHFQFEKKLKIS
ncbi:hypothetical protein [Flavobacterium sp.]|uniref:hypothetical protein n=1 Tax=Flavobacterium sp. TaxID=239 RepID=UPI0037B6D952